MKHSVSIVVPFHSGRAYLDICLESLLRTTPYGTEIIVVMNNSDTSRIDFTLPPGITALRIPESLGHAKAVNVGVENSSHARLVICDADTCYTRPWFEPLLALHDSITDIGITGVKLVNTDSGRIIDFGMGLSKYNNAHPFMDRLSNHPLTQFDREALMVCSACMCIDRDVFETVGGLDEDLHNFYTDTDLCLKVRSKGYSNWLAAASVVYHRGNSTDNNRSPYRSDVKAWYRGKHHAIMTPNMETYFLENYNYLSTLRDTDDDFIYVDISSVGDREWHRELIGSIFTLSTCYEFPAPQRDEERLELISRVDIALLSTNNPIIYFADRFIALQGNHLWKQLRPNSRDIVVDRNGNMVSFDSIDEE